MKNVLLSLVCLFIFFGCQSNAVKNVDGTYGFDADAWKAAMTALDPNFSKAPAELVTKMTDTFNQFNMVIKDKAITANFGQTVMPGTLAEVSKTDKGTVYKMTPTDEKQKTQTIIVTINGDQMTAGPEGNDKQVMYFKKTK
ncbi:MAG: hypothetical protein HQM16_15140 [Deltaproteobacteria bacterium]|nr:hypothetical protein [Deltaproteobacteria bacterium]